MEVIRPDEEPVSKTGVRLWRIASSSLAASALAHERAHRPTGRRRPRMSEIRAQLPVSPLEHFGFGPVVQRQRLLAYTQATAVRFRPGLLRKGLGTGDWGTRKRRRGVDVSRNRSP